MNLFSLRKLAEHRWNTDSKRLIIDGQVCVHLWGTSVFESPPSPSPLGVVTSSCCRPLVL